MKKIVLATALVIGITFFQTGLLRAEEFTDRKGFTVAFDAGAGLAHLADGRAVASMLTGFKIGGGLSERFLMLGEISGSIGMNSEASSLIGIYIAPQFFVTENYYIRPGIGFATFEESFLGATFSTGTGFSGNLATGYEFRMSRKFVVSPEVKFHYSRIEGGNYLTYGLVADFRWYF